MPKIITDPKTGKYGYYKDGIWNGLYMNKGKIYRDRVECLIIDNNQVFLEFNLGINLYNKTEIETYDISIHFSSLYCRCFFHFLF